MAVHISPDEMQEMMTAAVRSALDHRAISPFKAYTAAELADILSIDVKSVYEIPPNELPQCRVGPRRGAIRYFGADILAYLKGEDPVDVGVILDQVRSKIGAPAPVRAMPSSSGKKRRM